MAMTKADLKQANLDIELAKMAKLAEKELAAELTRLAESGLDLQWFELQRYPSPEQPRRLGPGEWKELVLDRARLRQAIEAGDHELALEAFEPLKTNPLQPTKHSLKIAGRRNEHPANTPSVSFLRAGEAIHLGLYASLKQLDPSECFDAARQRHDKTSHIALATVLVNLKATRNQIRSDFNAWLTRLDKLQGNVPKERRFDINGSTLADWVKFNYLPYFDLWLFAKAHNQTIEDRTMVRLLHMNTDDRPRDVLASPKKSEKLFVLATVAAMTWQHEASLMAEYLRDTAPKKAKPPAAKSTTTSAPKSRTVKVAPGVIRHRVR